MNNLNLVRLKFFLNVHDGILFSCVRSLSPPPSEKGRVYYICIQFWTERIAQIALMEPTGEVSNIERIF